MSGGSFVSRDPNNNCEFFDCPEICDDTYYECADGSFVGRDPNNNCEFFDCPDYFVVRVDAVDGSDTEGDINTTSER